MIILIKSVSKKHPNFKSFFSTIKRYNATNGNNLYKIPTSRTLLSRIVLELVVVTILGYPMLHIYVLLKGNVEPYSRGFFCDDENLKHPFIEEEIR